MTNSKPTPRPTNAQCFVGRKDNPIGYYPIYAKIGPTQIACLAKTDAHEVGFGISESEQTGNANLISEVFNVHHETGLTPRQLLEQRDELRGALLEIEKEPHTQECCGFYKLNREGESVCCGQPIDGFDRIKEKAKAALAKCGSV